MPIALVPYIGTGTISDPFRPDVLAGGPAIDLRPNPSVRSGWAFVSTSIVPIGAITLGVTLDSAMSGKTKKDAGTALGVSISSSTPRAMLPELLLTHATDLGPLWKPLKEQRRSDGKQVRRVWLGELAWEQVIEGGPGAMLSESFNKADSTTLGPDLIWIETHGDWSVVTNAAEGMALDAMSVAVTDATLATADHRATATIAANSGSPGPLIRATADGLNYYYGRINFDGTWQLYKTVGGATTLIGSLVESVPAVPFTIEVRAEGSSVSLLLGSTVKVGPITDTSIGANLRAGLRTYSTKGRVDSFLAADLGTATPVGRSIQAQWKVRGVTRGVREAPWLSRGIVRLPWDGLWRIRGVTRSTRGLLWDASAGSIGGISAFVSGNRVSVTLAQAVSSSVTADYERTLLAIANRIRDAGGYEAASFTNQPVIAVQTVGRTIMAQWRQRQHTRREPRLDWHYRTKVALGSGLIWRVRFSIAQRPGLAWRARQNRTKTNIVTWRVRSSLRTGAETDWQVRSASKRAARTPWTVRTKFYQSREAMWDQRVFVDSRTDSLWGVRVRRGKTHSLEWGERFRAGKSRTCSWRVRQAVIADQQALWLARSGASSLLRPVWNVAAHIASDRRMYWDLNGLASPPRIYAQLLWDDRAHSRRSPQLPWRVNNTVPSLSRSIPWGQRSLARAEDGIPWNFRSLAGPRVRSAWNTHGSVGGEDSFLWPARTPARKTAQEPWSVRSLGRVAPEIRWGGRTSALGRIETRWLLRVLAGADGDVSWRVRQLGSARPNVQWRGRAFVSAQRRVPWDTRRLSAVGVTNQWSIYRSLGPERTMSWSIKRLAGVGRQSIWVARAQALRPAQLSWDVHRSAAISRGVVWGTRRSSGHSSQALWRVYRLAPLRVMGDWDVRSVAARPIDAPWGVRAIQRTQSDTRWHVRRPTLVVEDGLVWRVRSLSGAKAQSRWLVEWRGLIRAIEDSLPIIDSSSATLLVARPRVDTSMETYRAYLVFVTQRSAYETGLEIVDSPYLSNMDIAT